MLWLIREYFVSGKPMRTVLSKYGVWGQNLGSDLLNSNLVV